MQGEIEVTKTTSKEYKNKYKLIVSNPSPLMGEGAWKADEGEYKLLQFFPQILHYKLYII